MTRATLLLGASCFALLGASGCQTRRDEPDVILSDGDLVEEGASVQDNSDACAGFSGWNLHFCLLEQLDAEERDRQLFDQIPELSMSWADEPEMRLYDCEGRETGMILGWISRPQLLLKCADGSCNVRFGSEDFVARPDGGTLAALGPHYFLFDPFSGYAQGVTVASYRYFTGVCTERQPQAGAPPTP